MTGYSASAYSIVVVCVRVIDFTLFFFLRNESNEKLSPFLIPGLLAAGMLGTVSAVIISELVSERSLTVEIGTRGFDGNQPRMGN